MNKPVYILGISCFYHDSAAVLVKDGHLIAAVQEERFTRKKHDEGFPSNAVKFCLSQAGITVDDIKYVCFYDKPFLKFERIIESFIKSWPWDYKMFVSAVPVWLKDKLLVKDKIKKTLNYKGEIYFCDHHMSHAASSFFVSPFEEAAILTVDGVGEWATTTIGFGKKHEVKLLKQINYPDSLGLFYSLFTYYLGFKPNSAEYKVMGLAPYGQPKYVDDIKKLITIYNDGSFKLNRKFFKSFYAVEKVVKKIEGLFGVKKRKSSDTLEKFHKDMAASLQKVTDEIMVKLALHAKEETGSDNLCLSGGVALNCVANSEILKKCEFKNIYIQPAAGDAGGALGAAYYVWHHVLGNKERFKMEHAFLGPSYDNKQIENFIKSKGVEYEFLTDDELIKKVAKLIADQSVVGWLSGRMEWGPRALGARSILADPRNKDNWQRVNLKIKFRESFRPFAPSVLREYSLDYFDIGDSPYMLFVAKVKNDKIPAVTHVDETARPQTVNGSNIKYYNLIKEFKRLTDCPVLINTSFNIRGEPIVCTPEDAFNTFIKTDIDYLVLENFLLDKKKVAVKYPFIKPEISHDAD